MIEQASAVPPQAVWKEVQTDWHICIDELVVGSQLGKFH